MASMIFLGFIIFISSPGCYSEKINCVCEENCEAHGLTEIPQCLPKSIKEIHVSYNNISQINESSFEVYDSLEIIDISNNKLSTVENGTFENVPKVTKISLRRNFIKSMAADVLNPLSQLEMFSVSENSIEEISETTFDRNVNLKSLYLYRNKLSQIPQNLFRNLRKLQRVNFSNNRISSLHVDTFSGNPSLKDLFMAYNRIDHLDAKLFEHNAKLEYVDISGNDLVTLEAGVFRSKPKLATIVMSDNPWHCDCHMKNTLLGLSIYFELDNIGKCWSPEGIGDLSNLVKMNISCQRNESKLHVITEQNSENSETKPQVISEQSSKNSQLCDDTNYTMFIVGGFVIILAQIMICFCVAFYRYVALKQTTDRRENWMKRKSANCYSYEIPIGITNKGMNNQNDYNYIVPTANENVYACISENDNKYISMIGYERNQQQHQAEDVYTVMNPLNVNLDHKYLTLDGKFVKYENFK